MPEKDSSTVIRTIRTLEALALGPRTAPQLAAQLDAHPRTMRRLLAHLVDEGYATRSGEGRGEYSATLKLVALAGRVIERTDLVSLAFAYVARLRNATGEASHFSVASDEGVMHLVQETGENVVMVKPRLGEVVPFHSTASGKALLAHRPDLLEAQLERGLPAYTDQTITDPADLLLELARVRERGYAVDELEQSPDLRCVAAPVFDHSNEAIGCVGISAPSMRLSKERVPEIAATVGEVATALSETLGYDRREKAAPGPGPATAEARR